MATLDEADIDVISLTEPDAGDKSFRKLIRPNLAWLAEKYGEVARDRFAGTWRPKVVQNILTNVTYCGHLVQKGDALARNCHDAAVTDEESARVAALRKLKDRNKDEGGNGKHAIHMSERGVLTPWLRCGSCGGRIAIKAVPTPDRMDPTKFRAAVLEAWSTRPLDERREALDRLVEKITLSDGGAHVDYLVKDEEIAFHQADPPGPP